jgi:hypothetical protein
MWSIFVLRATHSSIGHLLLGFFCSKGGFSPERLLFLCIQMPVILVLVIKDQLQY